jgi:glutaredoxin-like protein
MSLLKDSERKGVRERLKGLVQPVKLILFTQEMECFFCKDTRELIEEVAGLSEKIELEVLDFVKDSERADALGIDKIPALAVLGADGEDHGIRLFGIPSGYEFMSLLESFDLVSSGQSGLSDETKSKLKSITDPLHLQVFVTPTCPYCPRAVVQAFKFAVESPRIRASMVEATEFPHLSNKHQVGGVPHTVVGDSDQPMVGAYPESAAVDMLLAATGKL